MQKKIIGDHFKLRHTQITILLTLFLGITILAQNNGSIFGKVTDASNNEELIGANVMIVNTTIGAATDLDGMFQLKNLEPGIYSLKVSYISYQSIIVEQVKVESGTDARINIQLAQVSTELEEVVVTAEALKNSEVSVLKIQKNSVNIVDGMSAELIKKNNASDGTDILSKMTGVTISDGKYAFIRGVGDRYNNTMLNGATVPSTDPEKKSFSYDLIPASIIEQILTAKTSTPDKPADFSGGLVQIKTVEFPQKFILDINFSSSYSSGSNLSGFRTYNGGGKDFFAYDDGTRDLPQSVNGDKIVRGNYSDAELRSIGQSFSNSWEVNSMHAPINGSFRIAIGDKVAFGDDLLGYVSSFSYSNSFDYKELEKSIYDAQGPSFSYTGRNYTNTAFIGGIMNFSYKFGAAHKLSFKNTLNQTADDEVILFNGEQTNFLQYREKTALRYVARNLRSHQLMGEHFFGLFDGWNTEWNLSYAKANRDEPDARSYFYARDSNEPSEPMRFILDQSQSTRFYGFLDDKTYNVANSHTFKFFESRVYPTVKVGFLYDLKDRSFDARSFGFKNIPGGNFWREDSILQGPIEQIFTKENFTNNFIEIVEITKPSDSYKSKQTISSGFVMFDFHPLENLKIVAGVRYEQSHQSLESASQTGQPIIINKTYKDWLPSLNMTYILSEQMNLRFALTKTLARPDFRELAPFAYYDFLDNELVIGNDSLLRTTVNNYDFRYEYYPNAGELLALSLYYKFFTNPIEQVFLPTPSLDPIRSFQNAEKAENYGIEMEFRKSLAFISDALQNFSLIGNTTLIQSKISLSNAGFQAKERKLQGQAEYIINTGLYYDNINSGTAAAITFNKIGHRISKVGFGNNGDIIEMPRNQLDLSVSQKLFEKFSLKLSVKDLLQEKQKLIQQTLFGDKDYEVVNRNSGISLSIGYQL